MIRKEYVIYIFVFSLVVMAYSVGVLSTNYTNSQRPIDVNVTIDEPITSIMHIKAIEGDDLTWDALNK